MQLNRNKKIITAVLVIVFILDRFFKKIAVEYLAGGKIDLLGNLLTFNYAKNIYIAFSLPFIQGAWLNLMISGIIIGLIFLLLRVRKDFNKSMAVVAILFGASSNLADRIFYGYVVDYLDLKYFTVFNLADAMIVIGAIFFAWLVYFQKTDKIH